MQLSCFIGDNISVKIGQNHHLKTAADGRVYQIGRHNVDVPVICGNAGISFGNLMANFCELAVRFLHNIRLGDNAHTGLSVVFRIVKGGLGDAAGTKIRGHLEIHRHTGQLHAPATQDILTLSIFPIENPVDSLLRDGDRTHIGVQIQLPAQGYIGTFHGAAHRGGGGTFQQHIAGLDLRQHIFRNRFAQGHTVFNGQSLDFLQDDLACGNFLCKQQIKYFLGLGHNQRADAVAINDADCDHIHLGKILLFLVGVGNSCLLLFQQYLKCRTSLFDIHHNPPSPI